MVIQIFFLIGQLLCYVIIFLQVYAQDNGEITKLLDRKVTKQRNQRNIMTLFGQVIHFVGQIMFYLILIMILNFANSNTQLRAVVMTLKIVEFAIMSIIDVVTSGTLREALMKDLRVLNVSPKQE